MFDLGALAEAVARHGRVARVVIAASAGSAPREAGASMLVWADTGVSGGQSGTIGGGALEWEAAATARAALTTGDRLDKVPLGPARGQCCGGAVVLLTEVWDHVRLGLVGDTAWVRPLPGSETGLGGDMPLKVANRLRRARHGEAPLVSEQVQGWMIEPLARPQRQLWIWGAGHVGRALVQVLAPLPDLEITWIDVAQDRFPAAIPQGVRPLVAADPGPLVAHAPPRAEHLILTYSHALDLDLCHRLLMHGFGRCGLIGSATKWARFRSRLGQLGHGPQGIARIECPIGEPALGKHPQAIAIGVAGAVLRAPAALSLLQENAG